MQTVPWALRGAGHTWLETFVAVSDGDLVQTFSGRRCPAQEVGGKDHVFPAGCMVGVTRGRCQLCREGSDTVGPQEASSTERRRWQTSTSPRRCTSSPQRRVEQSCRRVSTCRTVRARLCGVLGLLEESSASLTISFQSWRVKPRLNSSHRWPVCSQSDRCHTLFWRPSGSVDSRAPEAGRRREGGVVVGDIVRRLVVKRQSCRQTGSGRTI